LNLKQDFRLLSIIQLLIGILMGIPTYLAWRYGETEAFHAFVIALWAIGIFTIVILILTRHPESNYMGTNDGLFFVTFTWVLGTAFAALPLSLSHSYPSYTDAYFEVMSGFTTTGATVLSTIEDKPLSILFWRSMTNWLGGMGIVVLFVAFLPMLGVSGTILVNSESVGPTKDKLTPKIGQTAMILWGLYVGLSALMVVILFFDGLSLYDAVTVTFSTLSAAGFCVKNASIGAFGKPSVDIIVTIFMMIAGANFALYYKIVCGKAKQVLKDGELQWYLGIFAVDSVLSALFLTHARVYGNFFTSLRYSTFQAASIMTTTGFATADYQMWPAASQMLLFLLFFVGGCAGSTGGGIKVIRVRALFTLAKNTITTRLHPNAVITNRVGDSVFTDKIMMEIAGFVGMYLATGILGALALTISGADLLTALSGSFLCLGNIGIGFGKVGPTGNFGFFPAWTKWVLSFLMLAGRLELFTVFSLFSSEFWRNRSSWITGTERDERKKAKTHRNHGKTVKKV